MDPWIHGSAAGAAARAAAGAAASAATVCTYYVILGGALRTFLSIKRLPLGFSQGALRFYGIRPPCWAFQ